MTEKDLSELEALFALSLPSDYRHTLLAYPVELPLVVRGTELVDHPKVLKDQNASIRATPLWGVRWPAKYFAIGDDGSGNIFYIDTDKNPSPVYVFDHEDRSFRVESPSLAEWIPQLVALYAK